MNWKRIARYALALWFAGFAAGFVEGLFAAQDAAAVARSELIGSAAAFALYLALFTRMAARADGHPILGAVSATALSLLCGWGSKALLPQVFGDSGGAQQLAVELALMAVAATFGVGLGSYLRDRRRVRTT